MQLQAEQGVKSFSQSQKYNTAINNEKFTQTQ